MYSNNNSRLGSKKNNNKKLRCLHAPDTLLTLLTDDFEIESTRVTLETLGI